jgi:hypothetical protein
MVIKNQSIDIFLGNRQFKYKNLLTDTLLTEFAYTLKPENFNASVRSMDYCYIKFDTPLTIENNSQYLKNDFDILIYNNYGEQSADISPNSISLLTELVGKPVLSDNPATDVSWNDYVGRKVCTLGFRWTFTDNFADHKYMLSLVDLSQFNIILQKNEEIKVTRIDTIESDNQFFVGTPKVKGLVHLSPIGMDSILGINRAYAKLIKIGWGHNPDEFEGGFPVEGNINYSITGIGEITFEDVTIPVVTTQGLFPSNTLYPSNNLFPSNSSYNYIIYQFFLYESDGENVTYTGENYLQSFPLNKDGTVSIKVKYERG